VMLDSYQPQDWYWYGADHHPVDISLVVASAPWREFAL